MPFIGRGGSSPPSDTLAGAFARRHRYRDSTWTPVHAGPAGQTPGPVGAITPTPAAALSLPAEVPPGVGRVAVDVALLAELARVLAGVLTVLGTVDATGDAAGGSRPRGGPDDR